MTPPEGHTHLVPVALLRRLTVVDNSLTVQYAKVAGAKIIAIDGGSSKRDFCLSLGASHYIDFQSTPDLISEVMKLTNGGAQSVINTTGSARAYAHAADMLRVGGTLSCGGIPPGTPHLQTSIGKIVIKGLKIVGSLVGSHKETMEAVELVRQGKVKPEIEVLGFKELPRVYERLEKGDVQGRVVLKIGAE